LVIVLLAIGCAVLVSFLRGPKRSHVAAQGLSTAQVRRADLDVVIKASGRIDSSRSSEIRCQLERLQLQEPSTKGGAGATAASAPVSRADQGNASFIISLVPEGTTVSRGEILCQFDASTYEELVRAQKIALEQSKADYHRADLDLQVAQIGLKLYREGETVETVKQFQTEIAQARSELTRHVERRDWLRRMLEKGYTSRAQATTEELETRRAEVALKESETAFRVHSRYTVARELKELESAVSIAEKTLKYETMRLKREEDRLAHYERMVEYCTIRAPHSGLVTYSNEPRRPPQVYEGAGVWQGMSLFRLSEVSQLGVEVNLNETMVNQVEPGMPVRIRADALPDRTLEGTVARVSRVPLSTRRWDRGSDATYYPARVEFTQPAEGLRPGLSVESEILAARRANVLAIPSQGIVYEDGCAMCYVSAGDRLERRKVDLGPGTPWLSEVVSGLREGELIVLNP
jgi:HlyD family secretion protein